MLYLAFIYHMHQPYYKNLLTQETPVPWVRLHGVKDYLDMVKILAKYPKIHQVFNLVPSLMEQVEDYTRERIKDRFLELSYKPAEELSAQEKEFILERFFSINKERVIALFPRYYELYLKKHTHKHFDNRDYRDLQVWFNLAWVDPSFRLEIPELKQAVDKGRFFSEDEKRAVLASHLKILKEIIPVYRKFVESGQVEVTISPYYHPILPLLYNSGLGKEAEPKTVLPKLTFSYPQDAKAHINEAISFFQERFGVKPQGMWPSEESVCEHILPFIIESGINWIVTDEAILFKSLKKKKRDTALLYQPYLLKREEGNLNVVFRDRNLSDLLGFVYHRWNAEAAAADFMGHLKNTAAAFKNKDILVTIAMDGENAWEYYTNDGHDFLNALYKRLSEADFVKAVTISEYLKDHPANRDIKRIAAGSWIFGNFFKWIGNPYKNKAWDYLTLARQEFQAVLEDEGRSRALGEKLDLARKQIYIAEGSDWFWWYGDNEADFDRLFRMHMANFYSLIGKETPGYLKEPLRPD
ncbi:MAG: glycoside hydrolase [Candidatus Omnitrophica bacterium]|nr:glycoside hydrolase [Candidatus Omnitrophota bacterium]